MEHALEALRLLCTGDRTRARELAYLLDSANAQRRVLTEETFDRAKELVEGEEGLIVVYDESWHEGIIGLVAGRLVEEYNRPAVVIARGEEFSKGSARSVNGLNIVDVLRSYEGILEDVGGHAAAAGFTVKNENLDELVEALRQGTRKLLSTLDLRPVLKVDLELPLENLSFDLGFELERFKPYGVGNPEPLFVAWDIDVLSSREVGRDRRHLKLNLTPGFEAIWFGGAKNGDLALGDKVAVVYTPTIEKWRGKEKVVLKIRDLKRI
jgi:single-stranded-DNA-specific exonuclease